ncbi:MAG: hypothetical protein SNH88_07115 [Rikenellaceae bacterium]
MGSTRSIGGIKGVSLWSPNFNNVSSRAEYLRQADITSLEQSAIAIPIRPDLCSYSESVSFAGGRAKVEHTLKLCTDIDVDLLAYDDLAEATSYGLVAFITLYSGVKIRVGYSPLLRMERMLSLTSISSESGSSKVDYPLKSWLFSSFDDQILL